MTIESSYWKYAVEPEAEVKSVHIILVEDDDVDAEAIERVLRTIDAEYKVVRFASGEAALAALRGKLGRQLRSEPYLILLDYNAPGISGSAFLDALRADPQLRRSVVFAITGSDLEEDKTEAYRHRVAGYLIKDDLGPGYHRLGDLLAVYGRAVEFPVM